MDGSFWKGTKQQRPDLEQMDSHGPRERVVGRVQDLGVEGLAEHREVSQRPRATQWPHPAPHLDVDGLVGDSLQAECQQAPV